jgi:hypothetical protein
VLEPLGAAWPTISAERKQKWLEIAQRLPTMPVDERERIQMRMTEWAKLSSNDRGQVRLNFLEAKQLSAEQRQAQWKAYQALPEEQRRQLADNRPDPADHLGAGARSAHLANAAARKATGGSGEKSNLTPNPAFAPPRTLVASTLIHASAGATTTLVSKSVAPPSHQQVGLPKIVATSRFVNPRTLLPRRGPQAAVAQTAAVTEPLERP